MTIEFNPSFLERVIRETNDKGLRKRTGWAIIYGTSGDPLDSFGGDLAHVYQTALRFDAENPTSKIVIKVGTPLDQIPVRLSLDVEQETAIGHADNQPIDLEKRRQLRNKLNLNNRF